jgi:hypothetical protein
VGVAADGDEVEGDQGQDRADGGDPTPGGDVEHATSEICYRRAAGSGVLRLANRALGVRQIRTDAQAYTSVAGPWVAVRAQRWSSWSCGLPELAGCRLVPDGRSSLRIQASGLVGAIVAVSGSG